MADEEIKNSFKKVKEDIYCLSDEINTLKLEIFELKDNLKMLSNALDRLRLLQLTTSSQQANIPTDRQTNQHPSPTHNPTQNQEKQAIQHIIPTHSENPTHEQGSEASKTLFSGISTRNEGVPTDRQTNQQTNQHITNPNLISFDENILKNINTNFFFFSKPSQPSNSENTPSLSLPHTSPLLVYTKTPSPTANKILEASEILKNLDDLKKELRLKFKKLTPQEMSIFSLIYNLEDQGEVIDYPLLATKTNLSESSIRDYTHKISLKGIPLIKEKINNKRVVLHISPDLKKLASLDTILKLREI